jgi:hypothetical protein
MDEALNQAIDNANNKQDEPLAFTPMPDPLAPEPDKKTYDAEESGIRRAAKELNEARQEGRIPQAESEPLLDRRYIHYSGEKVGHDRQAAEGRND